MLRTISQFFFIPADKPELALAQFSAFQRQVPLMYLMLVANTVALSLTHAALAPWQLTLGAPSVLYLLCGYRLAGWVARRKQTITAEAAIDRLRGTLRFTVVLGVAFTAWAFSLYGYGGDLEKGHVAFYMAITIIGCIFCLMHLRASAVLLVFIVLVPFVLFFASTGVAVFQMIAINVLLVSAALLFILQIYYTDFANLIASRKEIQAQQQEAQRLSEENLRLANLDSLTGLYNRRWFVTALEKRLAAAGAASERLVIGMIDLDGFKPVNDAYGHGVGDKVLIEVARRLSLAAKREGLEVARLGGDEFGFILKNPASDDAAVQAAARLIEDVKQPLDLPEVSVRVGGSSGVTIFPDHCHSAEEAFEHADYALYHAKQTRRGAVILFTQALATEIAYRSLVEQEIKRANLDIEFQLAFQPLWSESSNKTYGFEVLARWDSPVLGPVRPDVFIPVAERCGVIGALTLSIFTRALKAATAWPDDVLLSFNLSIKDIEAPQVLEGLLDILDRSGFDPHRLVFELTETAVMQKLQIATGNLRRIRDLGIGVALDDFGVGQSNLGQIHRLPVSALKIDRSFIADISESEVSQNIIRTLNDLARNLDCACVIEGVETQEQALALKALGLNLFQGYYFGRPMSEAAAADRLQSESAESHAA
jgi:diguanylate cyclase (GGDEF)-like protein